MYRYSIWKHRAKPLNPTMKVDGQAFPAKVFSKGHVLVMSKVLQGACLQQSRISKMSTGNLHQNPRSIIIIIIIIIIISSSSSADIATNSVWNSRNVVEIWKNPPFQYEFHRENPMSLAAPDRSGPVISFHLSCSDKHEKEPGWWKWGYLLIHGFFTLFSVMLSGNPWKGAFIKETQKKKYSIYYWYH